MYLTDEELKTVIFDKYIEGFSIEEIYSDLPICPFRFQRLLLELKFRYKTNYKDLPGEEWKSLELFGYPEYFVSNKGRVRRFNRLRKLVKDKDGYNKLNLYRKHRFDTFRVCRLVLGAFTNEIPFGKTANHLNWKRDDDRLENLEWATHQEQAIHNRLNPNDTRNINGQLNPQAKLTEKDVLKIINEFSHLPNHEVARIYNVNSETIRRIRIGERWSSITKIKPSKCVTTSRKT